MSVNNASQENHATKGTKKPLWRGWVSMEHQRAIVETKETEDKQIFEQKDKEACIKY